MLIMKILLGVKNQILKFNKKLLINYMGYSHYPNRLTKPIWVIFPNYHQISEFQFSKTLKK